MGEASPWVRISLTEWNRICFSSSSSSSSSKKLKELQYVRLMYKESDLTLIQWESHTKSTAQDIGKHHTAL